MEDKIITLERSFNPMLAQILKTRLEANGIPCSIAGENGPYNQILGVRLQVFEKDLEKCMKILEEEEDVQ
jgi:hypothetical protein